MRCARACMHTHALQIHAYAHKHCKHTHTRTITPPPLQSDGKVNRERLGAWEQKGEKSGQRWESLHLAVICQCRGDKNVGGCCTVCQHPYPHPSSPATCMQMFAGRDETCLHSVPSMANSSDYSLSPSCNASARGVDTCHLNNHLLAWIWRIN